MAIVVADPLHVGIDRTSVASGHSQRSSPSLQLGVSLKAIILWIGDLK